jgi:uncharacterized membrane protein
MIERVFYLWKGHGLPPASERVITVQLLMLDLGSVAQLAQKLAAQVTAASFACPETDGWKKSRLVTSAVVKVALKTALPSKRHF